MARTVESKVCSVAVRMSAADEPFLFTSQGGGIFGGCLEQTEGVREREREKLKKRKSEMMKRSKETKLQLATYPITQSYIMNVYDVSPDVYYVLQMRGECAGFVIMPRPLHLWHAQ